VRGLVQALNPPLSIWHWKPASPLPPVSLPVNVNVAVLLLLGLGGLDVMVVSGGVVSASSNEPMSQTPPTGRAMPR
jgi:hypothetical protein